ncbi:MAG: DUF1015 domain-containing protein [Ignavibacteriae bacterium]|nr:DUF1015 domain-containing protein [Ignavibacteriota bacterium]
MPDIKPFRALLYNPQKVRFDDVVAPPYDVISSQQQGELYQRNSHNVIRLIFGREENRYESAARFLERWKREDIIAADTASCLYVVSQRFALPSGTTVDRYGFIGACKLTEFGRGSVYPHERTHSKPKEDRLQLFQATHAMFSQVFGIYADPEKHIDRHLEDVMMTPPYAEANFEGVHNRLWRIDDRRIIFAIEDQIQRQRVFVADGHHRYETALLYCNSRRLKNPQHTGKEAYNFVPMFFANMSNPGLVVFPTHRLVYGLAHFNPSRLLMDLQQYFQLTSYDSLKQLSEALSGEKEHAFGLLLSDVPKFSLLRLKDSRFVERLGISAILASLDVTILHTLILKNILRLSDEDQEIKRYLDYEKDSSRTSEAVRSGKAQAAFLMNPTRIEHIRAVSEAGLVMPQKSTYFYPKLLSGLVMYSFLDE